MPDFSPSQLRRIESLFAALGSLSRLQLLLQMRKGEKSVSDLTRDVSMSQPVTSHHLALLRRVDLVAPRRAGKNVFYRLTPTGQQALQLLAPLFKSTDSPSAIG